MSFCREEVTNVGVQSHTTDPLYDMFMVYDRLVKGLFNQPKQISVCNWSRSVLTIELNTIGV